MRTGTEIVNTSILQDLTNIIFTEHLYTTASIFLEHIFNIKKTNFN